MKQIRYFLIFLALLIVIVIAANYINSKPRKAKQNPYEYNVDEFKKVDPALISYNEVRQIKVDIDKKGGIATFDGMIYLAAGNSVKTLSPDGKVISEFTIDENPHCIAVNEKLVVIGYEKTFAGFSLTGEKLFQTDAITDSTFITSLAIWNGKIVVADAGKRRVFIFNQNKKEKEFEGVSGAKNLHGFVIPSPYFDVAVNNQNELWVANTGMHTLQQYDENGNVVKSWEKISLQIEGFCGCCNPAQFTFLPDGRFVTSEKGMPRIKIYKSNGELESVVAAPDKFTDNGHAPEVACIGETVAALDYDKKMIRIFEKK
jgi:lipopolysaccharide export system protein LptC